MVGGKKPPVPHIRTVVVGVPTFLRLEGGDKGLDRLKEPALITIFLCPLITIVETISV